MLQTIAIFGIIAAVALVAGTIVAPAFAGNGNTVIHFSNKGKASSSGFGSTVANVQQNQIHIDHSGGA